MCQNGLLTTMKVLEKKMKINEPYFIAEMSANHAGKLESALKIVHAAKESGADCIKTQTYTPDTITIDCKNKYFKITDGLWNGYTLYDLYQSAYTPWEWQKTIKEEAEGIGLDFLSTPFDATAVDFLESLKVQAYKIASFELVDIPLIRYAAQKGKSLIISCGMGSTEEIQLAVDTALSTGLTHEKLFLLKCTSEYPADTSDMNLLTIPDMISRFGVKVGLSDHAMGSLPAVVGVSLGACIVEKHFCLSRSIKNPDSEFSMEPAEFKKMVMEVKEAVKARGKVSYELAEKEKSSIIFRRSLFAVDSIKKGEAFTGSNVRCIRPGYGIAPKYYDKIVGNISKQDYEKGDPIKKKDIP